MSKYEKPPLRVNRRLFVKTSAALLGAFFLPRTLRSEAGPLKPDDIDPVWGVVLDENLEELSFGEAFQLAKRLDRLLDNLPPIEVPNSLETAEAMLQEANNLFATERFVSAVNYPALLEFRLLPPSQHLGVLGSSNCSDRITFNIRQINPVSAWYQRDDFLWTVVHESAHLQQGETVCLTQPYNQEYRELIEASAELMTAEVMSVLALSGSYLAFYSLIDSLRGWAFQAAWSSAIKAGRMREFRRLRRQMSPGAVSEAGFERTMRRYQGNPGELAQVLSAYGAKPLNLAIAATVGNNNRVDHPALPRVTEYGSTGRQVEYVPPIILDDLAYLLENLEALAQDYLAQQTATR